MLVVEGGFVLTLSVSEFPRIAVCHIDSIAAVLELGAVTALEESGRIVQLIYFSWVLCGQPIRPQLRVERSKDNANILLIFCFYRVRFVRYRAKSV